MPCWELEIALVLGTLLDVYRPFRIPESDYMHYLFTLINIIPRSPFSSKVSR